MFVCDDIPLADDLALSVASGQCLAQAQHPRCVVLTNKYRQTILPEHGVLAVCFVAWSVECECSGPGRPRGGSGDSALYCLAPRE